jgi:hypothetical protein
MSSPSPKQLAEQIVYRTPSEQDAILIVAPSGEVLYASRGIYGGWIIKGKHENLDKAVAFWSFKREEKDIELSDIAKDERVATILRKLEELGLPQPKARKITYYYYPVKVVVKKVTDHYTVIDVVPEDRVVTAEAIHLYWPRHYSNKGYCYGSLCSSEERQKVLLLGKMLGLEVYDASVGKRDVETRIKLVTNTSELEKLIAPQPAPATKIETKELEKEAKEEEKVTVEELERMLQELDKGKTVVTVVPSPVSPVATAVTQATPPPPSLPSPTPRELVKIYELVMRLPSKYLVQQVKYIKTETGGVAEQRVWEGLAQQVASRLEGIRRTAYDKIKQLGSFAYVKEFERWIAVSDKAVKDAEELSKWVREELSKLPLKQLRPDIDIDKLYAVKAIEVYLKPEDAKLLLETAIAELEEARQELERRIQEAEQEKKRSVIRKLEQELAYTKQVLEQFKRFLQQLEERKIVVTAPPQQAQEQQQQKQRKAVAVTA